MAYNSSIKRIEEAKKQRTAMKYQIILREGQRARLTFNKKGEFKEFSLTRGTLTPRQIECLGMIVPPNEQSIPDFQKEMAGMVTYTAITDQKSNPKSLYQQFVAEWFDFYEEFTGLYYKMSGADGRHLKGIITYLTKSSSGNEEEALNGWKFLLSTWENLEDFHKKNTDLKYINSNLNRILQNARNINKKGNTSATSNSYVREVFNELQS